MFTNQTVRTIILIPTIISIAQVAGFNPVALALPASFMICDTITLPPHSKVNPDILQHRKIHGPGGNDIRCPDPTGKMGHYGGGVIYLV